MLIFQKSKKPHGSTLSSKASVYLQERGNKYWNLVDWFSSQSNSYCNGPWKYTLRASAFELLKS